MKTITLCLLVLVSASCLLSTHAKATDVNGLSLEDLDIDWEQLEAQLDNDDDYMGIDEFGFVRTIRGCLKKLLKTVRGVNCIVKEVTAILIACTDYVDAVDACGTQVPKDILAIVNSCKQMITMCNNIIHLNSTLCSTDDATDSTMSSKKCICKLFYNVMKLTRKINTTIKQCGKFPTDTSTCFVFATNQVKNSFNDFLPNINSCTA